MDSMVIQNEVLAIIPARGGSKGIPRKNIREFAGYPLIAYSIAAAHQSSLVNRVVVSTDDEQIAKVAREFGAEVPFLRPEEFARDDTTDLPVFKHVLLSLADKEGYHPDVVVQLRPTSPIRPPTCVNEAVTLLLTHPEADCVRGVVSAGQNPHKMWRIEKTTGHMSPLLHLPRIDEPYNAPRQQLPSVYWQTGHIDAIRPVAVLEKNSMTGDIILPLIIDSRYTVDIDNLADWARYEWVVYNSGLEMVSPGKPHRSIPSQVDLLALDFDGVLTDNRVWIDDDGKEAVMAYRSDAIGLHLIQDIGVKVVVISSEVNPVVSARCRKMGVPVIQGVKDKAVVLSEYLKENHIPAENVIFLGNDVNDLPCFPIVGCAIVVADAQTEALRAADRVLLRKGGYGAVRELCDIIQQRRKETK
jgi:YrbI family 3-deoxy-D-manno-octulosonate 8-phosphate phosphatase